MIPGLTPIAASPIAVPSFDPSGTGAGGGGGAAGDCNQSCKLIPSTFTVRPDNFNGTLCGSTVPCSALANDFACSLTSQCGNGRCVWESARFSVCFFTDAFFRVTLDNFGLKIELTSDSYGAIVTWTAAIAPTEDCTQISGTILAPTGPAGFCGGHPWHVSYSASGYACKQLPTFKFAPPKCKKCCKICTCSICVGDAPCKMLVQLPDSKSAGAPMAPPYADCLCDAVGGLYELDLVGAGTLGNCGPPPINTCNWFARVEMCSGQHIDLFLSVSYTVGPLGGSAATWRLDVEGCGGIIGSYLGNVLSVDDTGGALCTEVDGLQMRGGVSEGNPVCWPFPAAASCCTWATGTNDTNFATLWAVDNNAL